MPTYRNWVVYRPIQSAFQISNSCIHSIFFMIEFMNSRTLLAKKPVLLSGFSLYRNINIFAVSSALPNAIFLLLSNVDVSRLLRLTYCIFLWFILLQFIACTVIQVRTVRLIKDEVVVIMVRSSQAVLFTCRKERKTYH